MGEIFGWLVFLLRTRAVRGSPARVTIELHNKFSCVGTHLNGYHWGTSGTNRRKMATPEKRNIKQGQQCKNLI